MAPQGRRRQRAHQQPGRIVAGGSRHGLPERNRVALVPVDRWNVAVVAVAAALPIVPLVMLEIPVAEILRRILGILA